jgi:hypothetical protein
VQFAAMQALEHCLACYVDIVPARVAPVPAVGGGEGKRPAELAPQPNPTGTQNTPAPGAVLPTAATSAQPMNAYTAYCHRVQTMSLEQVVQNARAVLQKARETGISMPAPEEGSHSLVEVVRNAFAPSSDVIQADHVEVVGAPAPTVVETSPPPTLKPVPVTPATSARTTATVQQTAPASSGPSLPGAPAPFTAFRPAPSSSTPTAADPAGRVTAVTTVDSGRAPSTSFRPMPYPSTPVPADPAGRVTAVTAVENGRTQPSVRPAVASTPAPGGEMTTSQLLILLRESPYPSVRELSVQRLVAQGQVTMPVAEALLKAALGDATPGVRAACLRGLMKLQVTGPALASAVRQLQSDRDPRVRSAAQEVGRWLQTVSAGPALTRGNTAN